MGVATSPGQMQLKRIWSLANSKAMHCVQLIKAALLAEYAEVMGWGRSPKVLEIFRTDPFFRL